MINLLKKTIKKEEIKTMDELRYSYDWLPLLRQYKKFDKVVKLSEDAFLTDVRVTDTERKFIICLIKGNKVFSKIFFKSAYDRDIIEDFKNQIENLHRETNGRYIDDIPYIYFTANPTFVCRFSSQEEPTYEKLSLHDYNELFNTEYASVKEAVENNPNVLFYEEEME